MRNYDIEFFWDPVCPFAWITSRWITKVSDQTGYKVDWRFISLRLLNKQRDYATEFPPGLREWRGLSAPKHGGKQAVNDRHVPGIPTTHAKYFSITEDTHFHTINGCVTQVG